MTMSQATPLSEKDTLEFLLNWTQVLDSPSKSVGGHDTVLRQIEYAVGGAFTPIFCILGMVGNVLAVVTWTRPALRSSTGRFLSAQAVADFGVLLLWMLTRSARQWLPSLDYDVVYATFFSYLGMPLYFFFVQCSVWITLAITVERYIMVCWATHAKSLCGEKQATIGILIIAISCFVSNIPMFFLYDVTRDSSGMARALNPTSFGTGSSAKIYNLYISCISLIAVPWFAVLFFNYKIVSQIASANRRMLDKKSSDASRKAKKTEWQITRLLLAVTFTYLSVMGPFCLTHITDVIYSKGVDPYHKSVASTVTRSGYVLNSSLNFILYCMMGRRFRRELKTMLGIKLSEEDMTTNYTSSSDTGTRSGISKSSAAGSGIKT